MRRGVKTTGIALAALLSSSLAMGEVRLAEDATGALSVEISSTPRGPWTPTGSVTDLVLNPSGDLFGDSMPGWDSRGSRLLSAWIRPGSGILHRSLGTEPGWRQLVAISSPGAQGQPVVDDLDGGWAVTWQQADAAGSRVLVTGTTVDGIAVDPLLVSGGLLVGTSPSGDLLHVITMDASRVLWCTTVSFSFIPTQPIPIQLSIVGRVRLGRSGQAGGYGPQSPGNGPGRLERGTVEVVAPPLVVDVLRDDGSSVGVVTWWGDDGRLHGVDLGADGPSLPGLALEARPGKAHADAALDALLLEASSSSP
jgi:hypothetical protein